MTAQNSFNDVAKKIISVDEMIATEAEQSKKMPFSMKLFDYAVLMPEGVISAIGEMCKEITTSCMNTWKEARLQAQGPMRQALRDRAMTRGQFSKYIQERVEQKEAFGTYYSTGETYKFYRHEDTGKLYLNAGGELEAIEKVRKGFLCKKFRAQIADQWQQNLENYKDYSDLVIQGKLKPTR